VQSNGIALAFHGQVHHSASQFIGLNGFVADRLEASATPSRRFWTLSWRLCCLSKRSIQDQQNQIRDQHDCGHARDGKH
jgi:hypothetical protein